MNYEDLYIKESFNLGNDVEIILAHATSKSGFEYLACFLYYEEKLYMLGFDKDYYCLRKRFNKK